MIDDSKIQPESMNWHRKSKAEGLTADRKEGAAAAPAGISRCGP